MLLSERKDTTMEDERIKEFVLVITGMNRDLESWEKEEKIPTKEQIQNKWCYLKTIIKITQELGIDKSPVVCQYAKNCVAKFIRLAPECVLA